MWISKFWRTSAATGPSSATAASTATAKSPTCCWINASPMTLSAKASVRFPAEWEPHAATWLAWPHFRDDWPGKFEPIPWVYAEIIRNLGRHERVELIVNDEVSERRARKTLDPPNALITN